MHVFFLSITNVLENMHVRVCINDGMSHGPQAYLICQVHASYAH